VNGDEVVDAEVAEAVVIGFEIGPVLDHAVARLTYFAFIAFGLWLVVGSR
jgi:hypothetical protein